MMKACATETLRAGIIGSGIVATTFLAAFSFGLASPAINDPADVKALNDLETQLNLQVDMKKAIPYYRSDATVYDIPAPGVYHGRKQIYAGFEPQLAPLASQKLTIPDFNVVSDGVMACVAFQLQDHLVYKTGASAPFAWRDIDIFRKVNGRWEIVQQHLSLPTDPKTGLAVVNGPVHTAGLLDAGADAGQNSATDPGSAKTELLNWAVLDANTTDVDNFGQLYGPGDSTIIYDVFYPGALRGLQQIKDYYRPFFASVKSVKASLTQPVVDTDGSLGAVSDQQTLEITGRDGSHKFISIRQSDCLHRVDGKWYSVFEMTSFPVDLKTGKAVMKTAAAAQH